jgi:hypothetical protein
VLIGTRSVTGASTMATAKMSATIDGAGRHQYALVVFPHNRDIVAIRSSRIEACAALRALQSSTVTVS